MIETQEIRTIFIFQLINWPQVNKLFYTEQLNIGTHCHVRLLLQTACVLSKRNLENSFLNQACHLGKLPIYLSFLSVIVILMCLDTVFIRYFKLTSWITYMHAYVRWVWKTLIERFNRVLIILTKSNVEWSLFLSRECVDLQLTCS